uniref:Putative 8.9 kDa family member n=1 Tax=Rhipicephalus pulchellus TaxID=72859 RepID=L7LQT3_RHIPC
MIFIFVFVIAMTTSVLGHIFYDPYYIGQMRIVNNTCRYRDYGVPDGVCLDLSVPCISVCCRAKKSQMVLTGCPLPHGRRLSSHDEPPFWPACCVKETTLAPVLIAERSLSPETEEHSRVSAYNYRPFH